MGKYKISTAVNIAVQTAARLIKVMSYIYTYIYGCKYLESFNTNAFCEMVQSKSCTCFHIFLLNNNKNNKVSTKIYVIN